MTEFSGIHNLSLPFILFSIRFFTPELKTIVIYGMCNRLHNGTAYNYIWYIILINISIKRYII